MPVGRYARMVLHPPVVAPRAVGSSGDPLGITDSRGVSNSKDSFMRVLTIVKTTLGVFVVGAALAIWIAAVFVCRYLFGEYGFILPALVYAWVLGDWIYEDYLGKQI